MPEPPTHTPERSALYYRLLIRRNGTQYTYAIRQQAETDWHEFPTLLSAFEYLERHLPRPTPPRPEVR